jgi:trehalose 6-phosphate synthase
MPRLHQRTQESSTDVVLASDRGPVTFVRRAGRLVPQPRPGSVVGVLQSAARAVGGRVAWVSTTTSALDEEAWQGGSYERLGGATASRLEPVFVEPATYRRYYDEAGVRMLWFAHHDLWDELPAKVGFDPTAFSAYESVNQTVARRIARLCRPGSLVVVHDYQLATVASTLRRLAPGAAVAHFLHTPFAPPAALRRLPGWVAGRVLEGMLSADLLGFQRPAWAEDFMSCCRLLGAEPDVAHGLVRHGNRVTWVRCYPTPVDPAEVLEHAYSAGALRWARRLAASGTRTVVRIDRLDPAKNALRGFQAFGLLLERRPELRGRVRFLAFLVPSRQGVAEYRDYAERTFREVGRINARFPGAVRLYEGDDRERALGALRAYDVLLVNAVRDGMNLVAQEGPLVNQVNGSVVLSARTGAADLLGEGALSLHDPTDTAATAEALERALALPATARRERAGSLRAVITSRHPADWLASQLKDLRAIHDGGEPPSGPGTSLSASPSRWQQTPT